MERPPSGPEAATLRFRRPREADHRLIVDLVDEWWGGQRIRHLLPRLWFQHCPHGGLRGRRDCDPPG